MSIFKDTFYEYVQKQLKAREIIISQGSYDSKNDKNIVSPYGNKSRNSDFLRYTSGKNSWVRMTSFVDFNGKIGSKTYSGDELAKKYILEGGVLYNTPAVKDNNGKITTPSFSTLRSSVGRKSSIYGGDLDIGGDRPFGYRPMPGITSVQVLNKSAYGSLREATIKFYAWDKHQLEELELLFMRTGYSVLLEWGWSQYLDSNNLNNIKIKNFSDSIINPFPVGSSLNDELIYKKIEEGNKNTYGNYDAMLGYIKNFSWSIMPNGGFDCSTTLISRGELISSLRLNVNTDLYKPASVNIQGYTSNNVPLSQFETIMLSWLADISSKAELPNVLSGGVALYGQQLSGSLTSFDIDNFKINLTNTNQNYTLIQDNKSRSKYDTFSNIYPTSGTPSTCFSWLTIYPDEAVNFFDDNAVANPEGFTIEYARFDTILGIINLFFNIKDDKNNIITKILIPSDEKLCLASPNTVSIDPSVCIVRNSKAVFFNTGSNGPMIATEINPVLAGRYSFGGGHQPNVYTLLPSSSRDPNDWYPGDYVGDTIDDFIHPTYNDRGLIRNIYVSVFKVIEIYRNLLSNSSEVTIIDFLKALLDQISRALGGINNFQLHTTKSEIEIIDVKYLEKNAKNNKFIFNLLGLKSICRDIKMISRVFENQSTMMGIAAQNNGNVGDIYSSTQTTFNKGLTDRILKEKTQGITTVDSSLTYAEDQLKLQEYVLTIAGVYALGSRGYPPPGRFKYYKLSVLELPSPDQVSNAMSLYRTYVLNQNQKQLGQTAIIPFELEITLEGISGIVIGHVFKINKDILPQSYNDKNVGFIVTGVSHNLQNNDWITTIKSQICLLN